MNLNDLGWDDGFAAAFEPYDNCIPARVAAQHRGAFDVLTEHGELRVQLAGRLRHEAASGAELPAVGDWVALRDETIQGVLPRRSAFSRKVAWSQTEAQVVAANLDTVFVVSGLDGDLNPRRLERYLTLAWESGATPVLVLTKADLCADREAALFEVEQVALGVSAHVVSNVTGEGLDKLAQYLAPAKTVALLGSSGVGKSTLANRLLGEELQATKEIAEDGRGRHTTSSRHLFQLPGGALLVDTPGLREVQLWDADEGIQDAFADVDEVAARCRFNDCSHEQEPGCAVQAAIAEGTLPLERLDSYRLLQRELRHLAVKQDARLRSEEKKKRVAFARSLRKTSW
ncbi:MAG: ribosome biosis GTPase / thiamine phosphate phosphatase [Gaiellaceae bacterium]|nr:ribosome biosis GTPase / thiamine phosphate phosphatase [Gaiellaceae bacterium]